jgi:Ni/Fe-hydrogenase subunit HybB-like protein
MGAIVPMVILLKSSWRSSPRLRGLALMMVVGGLVAYRWDINLSGQMIVLTYLQQGLVTYYTSYVPSLIEILVGAGIVAFGALSFSVGVQYLKIVDHPAAELSLAPEILLTTKNAVATGD